MEQKRKQIIINEIKYWKQTRLLPEQYCDYLLALYTEGNEDEMKQATSKRVPAWLGRLVVSMIAITFFLSLLVIYFTELSFVLQTLILSLFVMICFISVRFLKKSKVAMHLLLIIGALSLLIASVRASDVYVPNDTVVLSSVVAVNCLVWLLIGWRFSILYFVVSGAIGLMLLFLSLFF